MNIEFLTTISAFLTCFGFLYFEIKDTNSEIKDITTELRAEIKIQQARADKLYEMFIDAVNKRNLL